MKENKKKRVVKSFMKLYLENPQDIKKIALLVSLVLKDGNTIEVHFPIKLFGIGFKTIMREDMESMVSFRELSINCISFYMW